MPDYEKIKKVVNKIKDEIADKFKDIDVSIYKKEKVKAKVYDPKVVKDPENPRHRR